MHPSDFFMSATHRAAVDGLLKHVAGSFCSAALYGAAGTGKTAVLDIVAAKLAVGPKRMIRVTASAATPSGLRNFTAQVAGPPRVAGLADQDIGEALEALTAVGADGTRIVLVVDGAEALLRETLDCIQLACEMQPLLQVVLSGRPEFEARLAGAEFSFLRRRVTHTFTLSAFSTDAAAAFVEHRLRSAGLATKNLFASDTFEMLLRHGAGNPGRIGDVLDRALVAQSGKRRNAASPNPPRRGKGGALPTLFAQGAAFRRPPKLATALALMGVIAGGWLVASMLAGTAAKQPSQAEAAVDPPAAGLPSPQSQLASRQPVDPLDQTAPERADHAPASDVAPAVGPAQEQVAVRSAAEPSEPEAVTPTEQQAATPTALLPATVNSPSITITPSRDPESSASAGRTPASAPRPISNAASSALGPGRAGPLATVSAAAPDGRRCRNVVLKMQLGEDPSDADKHFLRSGCRSDR